MKDNSKRRKTEEEKDLHLIENQHTVKDIDVGLCTLLFESVR